MRPALIITCLVWGSTATRAFPLAGDSRGDKEVTTEQFALQFAKQTLPISSSAGHVKSEQHFELLTNSLNNSKYKWYRFPLNPGGWKRYWRQSSWPPWQSSCNWSDLVKVKSEIDIHKSNARVVERNKSPKTECAQWYYDARIDSSQNPNTHAIPPFACVQHTKWSTFPGLRVASTPSFTTLHGSIFGITNTFPQFDFDVKSKVRTTINCCLRHHRLEALQPGWNSVTCSYFSFTIPIFCTVFVSIHCLCFHFVSLIYTKNEMGSSLAFVPHSASAQSEWKPPNVHRRKWKKQTRQCGTVFWTQNNCSNTNWGPSWTLRKNKKKTN